MMLIRLCGCALTGAIVVRITIYSVSFGAAIKESRSKSPRLINRISCWLFY